MGGPVDETHASYRLLQTTYATALLCCMMLKELFSGYGWMGRVFRTSYSLLCWVMLKELFSGYSILACGSELEYCNTQHIFRNRQAEFGQVM